MINLKKIFNIDDRLERKGGESESILVRKGNQVHLFLLYLGGIYMIIFALINYYYDDKVMAALVNVCSLPFVLLAFYFFKKGWTVASKLLNLSQITVVIILIFLVTRSSDGLNNGDSILVFFIPVFIGTMIVFQGKERNFGYIYSLFILALMSMLIVSDFHLGNDPAYSHNQIRRELALNLIGAAIATMMEIVFILLVSNRIDEELIKTNKELDNFVYSVSHDLRSPLLSVKGLLSLMKERAQMDEKSVEYLALAEKTVNHLDDTIREILAYSRNTRLGLSLEKFDLKTMTEQVYEDLRYVNGENICFSLLVEGTAEITSDRSRVNTVLRNVIGNAIKYSKPTVDNPRINVEIKRNNKNDVLVRIEDNGEGISNEKLEKVFDMFYRGTSTGQGTGLGLYICREIINKLNGNITIRSEIGVGTTVELIIPQEETN